MSILGPAAHISIAAASLSDTLIGRRCPRRGPSSISRMYSQRPCTVSGPLLCTLTVCGILENRGLALPQKEWPACRAGTHARSADTRVSVMAWSVGRPSNCPITGVRASEETPVQAFTARTSVFTRTGCSEGIRRMSALRTAASRKRSSLAGTFRNLAFSRTAHLRLMCPIPGQILSRIWLGSRPVSRRGPRTGRHPRSRGCGPL